MNRLRGFESLTPAKTRIATAILKALGTLPGLQSATIVGSFVDRADLSEISDIDTVGVFERLTPNRFADAVRSVSALTGGDLGLATQTVKVNATLGPIKHDAPNTVVVHLMLYDRVSHREHVLKSPFTCLDWERSPVGLGARLADIYPVGRVGVSDFVAARRGLANYIADLDSGVLSYRRFEADDEQMVEVPERMMLDQRHAGEYSYHIIRNLVVNALKMVTGENRFWEEADLRGEWKRTLPQLAKWIPFYETLRQIKSRRGVQFPEDVVARTRGFLDAFSAQIERLQEESLELHVVRHARTAGNDGTFLGWRRDPAVSDPGRIEPLAGSWNFVHSSQLRRAVETARALAPGSDVRIDKRLAEIDYGQAEGLTVEAFRERFPDIAGAWARGEDPAFPGGEGTGDVRQRLHAYLDALPEGTGKGLVVTHNVVMRVLTADILGFPAERAHRLPVDHLEPLKMYRMGGRWVPNWTSGYKARLLDAYVGWNA